VRTSAAACATSPRDSAKGATFAASISPAMQRASVTRLRFLVMMRRVPSGSGMKSITLAITPTS
jgi:hypothetical protein